MLFIESSEAEPWVGRCMASATQGEDVERPDGPGSTCPRLTFGVQTPRGIPARSGRGQERVKKRARQRRGLVIRADLLKARNREAAPRGRFRYSVVGSTA